MAESEFNNMKEKINHVEGILNKSIEDMFNNNEKFKEYLELMSRLPHYSMKNLALIHAQKPDSSMTQGFVQWKNLERYVKKGEKGIWIYAPTFKNQKEILKDKNGNPVIENGKEKVTIKKVLTGFVPVKVFDISQTDGKDLPKAQDFVSDVKTGQKKMDYEKLYELVKNAIQENARVPVHDQTLTPLLVSNPGAKGYYSHDSHDITIRPELSIEHKFKTLVHEFAHSQLHAKNDPNSPFKDSSGRVKEIHAESVAFCVSSYYGLDTSDYSIGYIATWAQDLELAKAGLSQIQSIVRSTIQSIDNIIAKNEQILLSENQNVASENNIAAENKIDTQEEQTPINIESELTYQQVESNLNVYTNKKSIREFEPLKDYSELFTDAVPRKYIENFTSNMDLINNDNPPYFEILDKQSLSFLTGQFVKDDPNSENYEFQIQGQQVLTGKDFETGDYLITNVLSNGTDINIAAKDFDDQFFIESNNNDYNISVYKADGSKENVGSFNNVNIIKAQYDFMAVDKTRNQEEFANTMLKRIDLAMNKTTRDSLLASHSLMDNKIFNENRKTLERHFSDASIPSDKNNILLLTEYLRATPSINNLEDLQKYNDASSELASERLGMNKDTYTLMITHSINQVIDNTMSLKNTFETQVPKNAIVLTRESINDHDYVESLKTAETYSDRFKGINVDRESHYQQIAKENLDQLLKMYDLDKPLTITSDKKLTINNEVPTYQFKVRDEDGKTKNLVIADREGMFPYSLQKGRPIDLHNTLSNTSGVQMLSLKERENTVNNILGVENQEDKKKESVTENDWVEMSR